MSVIFNSGTLSSLAGLVGALVRRRSTGALRLVLDGRTHSVYLQNGDIVDADGGRAEDTLGQVALEAGLLSSDAVAESLCRMAEDRTRSQKDILVEMGDLGDDALQRVLRMTLIRRATRMFGLAGATQRFDELEHGRLEGGPVEARWVVHRGLRTYYDEHRLDLEVGSLVGKAIRLAADPAEISAAFGFAHEELTVVRYLAKKHYWELSDLVDSCQMVPRVVVLVVVHALDAFEQLDVKPLGAVNRYRRAAPRPVGTMPPLGAPTRLPAASQPLCLPDRAAASGEHRDVNADPVQVARAMSASEHFRKGEVALRRQDFAAAIEEFRLAIDLDKYRPEYHAYLAWSRWCEAKSKDDVLSEVQSGLIKAIKLSGHRCVPAFYFRGLMFDARGEHDKAYRNFQIVRSLDEGHVDAARRMHLIERRNQVVPQGLIERQRRK